MQGNARFVHICAIIECMEQKTSLYTLEHPVTFVIFGITGDLARKKLLPSLWDLYQRGNIVKKFFSVIGFSRSHYSNEQFRDYVQKILFERDPSLDESEVKNFSECFLYEAGDFLERASYEKIKICVRERDAFFGKCATKIAYLAVAPEYYEKIFENIHSSGLLITCTNEVSGLGRILVEKPFGKDVQTARALDKKLGSLFKEEQIFRIDHYLAKETIQNILNFRFANHIFEPLWNKNHIESIEIRLAEDFGVEGRGAFYDGVGALRDVGQNHILQMLATTIMQSPLEFSAEGIRTKRLEALDSFESVCTQGNTDKECKQCVRAQYEGYREEAGVAKDSKTETYFKIYVKSSLSQWEGVSFLLESGKAMEKTETFIRVHFKQASFASLCPLQSSHGCANTLTFHIKPEEGISIVFWAKKPGFSRDLDPHNLHFQYKEGMEIHCIPDAYEYVLFEAIRGDQTLFPGTEEIRAQWEVIAPLLAHWEKEPLYTYKKGSNNITI